jgi:hypothetical protein
MVREIKTAEYTLAASYAYLEHILRITTPKFEAERLVQSCAGKLQIFMRENIRKKETQAQEPLHNLENAISYEDLTKISNPTIAIFHYQMLNGHLRTEEIFPDNGRFPVCHILSISSKIFILYTYQMTCLDGFDPFTSEKRYPVISEEMLQSFAGSLYVENNRAEIERKVMIRDEHVPSVMPVSIIKQRSPSPIHVESKKSKSPVRFNEAEDRKSNTPNRSVSRNLVRYQDETMNRRVKTPNRSERASRSPARSQGGNKSKSPMRSQQDFSADGKLKGTINRKSPSPIQSRNNSRIVESLNSSYTSSASKTGNRSIVKDEMDIVELDKSESSSDAGTDVKLSAVDSRPIGNSRRFRAQDRSFHDHRDKQFEDRKDQPRSSYQELEIGSKHDNKPKKSWKPTFEKWEQVEKRVLDRQKKRDQCAALNSCIII